MLEPVTSIKRQQLITKKKVKPMGNSSDEFLRSRHIKFWDRSPT